MGLRVNTRGPEHARYANEPECHQRSHGSRLKLPGRTWQDGQRKREFRDQERSQPVPLRPANYDIKNNLVVNYLRNLPKANGLWNSLVTRGVLDNWQTSGIASQWWNIVATFANATSSATPQSAATVGPLIASESPLHAICDAHRLLRKSCD